MHPFAAPRTSPLVTNPHFDSTADLPGLINRVTVVINNIRQIQYNAIGQSNFYCLIDINQCRRLF